MRIASLLLVACLVAWQTGTAQQARVKKYQAQLVGTVVLRDVEDKYNAQIYNKEMPDPDASTEQRKLEEIKKNIKKDYPNRKSTERKTASTVPQPTIGISFVADTLPGIPPDNYSAVSKGNKAVTVMNQTITVHNALTGAMLLRKGLYAFSLAVGLTNSGTFNNNYRYDPKVVYDPVADRFICVMLNGIDQYNYIIVAFSQSNDPTGRWNFYKFYGDYMHDTTWFDYPAIAITQNELFLTGNKVFYDSSWQAGFTRSVIYQFRKQDGYDSSTVLNYQIWDSIQYAGQYLRCLYPVNPGDSVQGPGQYFVSNRDFETANDTIFLVNVPDTVGAPDSTLTITPVLSTLSYGVPPDARQPDTSVTLATNDDRVVGGFMRGNEIQFVEASLNTANGASAVYHGVISNVTTAPACTARLFSIDTLDFGYPNISFAGNVFGVNQSIISFDYSGPRTHPSFGAILFDGSNYSDMLTVKAGDSVINLLNQKEQRWGDYSGSQPDWNTVGSVWVEGIFGRKPYNYGNYMAQLVSPYRVGIPAVPAKPATPVKLYPNPASEFVSYEFNVGHDQYFSFMIYDMRGRLVDKVLDQYCNEGRNVIQFNIAPFKPGTYVLKAVGKDETINVHTFVRK